MANIYQKFGENIRTARKQLDLSQEELAAKINRDARSILDIEAGRRNPTMATIHKLCLALKTRSSKLLSF